MQRHQTMNNAKHLSLTLVFFFISILPGHTFSINDSVKTIDAGPTFNLVTIGIFQLDAGAQEIIVTLPPGSSTNDITLKASNLTTITLTSLLATFGVKR